MRIASILGLGMAGILAIADVANAQIADASYLVEGIKYPNSPLEGHRPVKVSVLAFDEAESLAPRGFTELLPYVLRSPDQDEAGSCLYMSLTGIAEWWLAKSFPKVSRKSDGPLDLSERYMMNLAKDDTVAANVDNWKTDSIYIFNDARKSIRNKDYRFTKGWFTTDEDGDYVKSKKGAKGAKFGTQYNWIDELDKAARAKPVKLPKFKREVIYADPESNQWNTGVMPDDIIERIKAALVKNRAPVQVIYNHFGYWHASVILGFDDKADNRNCQFVHKFLDYLKNPNGPEPDPQPPSPGPNVPMFVSEAQKDNENNSKNNQSTYEKTKRAYDRGGGCNPKGVFYVRDSIYADKKGPVYRYDLANPKSAAPYTKRIVMIEYDWVRYMANHAVQITADWE